MLSYLILRQGATPKAKQGGGSLLLIFYDLYDLRGARRQTARHDPPPTPGTTYPWHQPRGGLGSGSGSGLGSGLGLGLGLHGGHLGLERAA